MPDQNKLARIVGSLRRIPAPLRKRAISLVMGRVVPLVGTARLRVEEMTEDRVVVTVRNRRPVQNHIHSVHAAAMALVAETATGFVVGMNVPNDKLPLIKSMKIDYTKRSHGDIRAEASLTPEQRARIREEPRGDVDVEVTITDGNGNEPVRCQMIWAWIPL